MDTTEEFAVKLLEWLKNGCKEDYYTTFLEQYEYDGGSFEDGMGSYFDENNFPFLLTDTWRTFFDLYYNAVNATWAYDYSIHYNVTFNKEEHDPENDIIYHSREDYEAIMAECKQQILEVEQEFESQKSKLSEIIIEDIKKYLS